MKTITIFILVLISFIPAVIAPIWYGSGNDTGLIGRWSCEGNFVDSSGQGNHGTQSGGVKITSGAKGRGCGFPGGTSGISNDGGWITAPYQSISNGNISVFAWIKATQLQNFMGAVSDLNATGGNTGWSLYVHGDNTVGTYLGSHRRSTQTISANSWYHIGFTYNGSELNLYINGVVNRTDTGVTYTGTSGLRIGDFWSTPYAGTDVPFNGTIDEVRIYNRSLSASEISALYNSTQTYHIQIKTTPTLGGLNDTPAPTASNETGLVGYWKMDDLVNGNTTDSSGYGNNGSVIGATFNSSGRWNKGYSFDGVNDEMNVGNASNLNLTTSFTFSAWVYATSAGKTIISKRTGNDEQWRFSLQDSGPVYSLYWFNGASWKQVIPSPSKSITLNKWEHAVFTYDGVTAYFYIDGVQYASSSSTIDIKSYPGSYVHIGQDGGNTASRYWNGSIDEVRIYNRSLSADEVKELYLSKGLVGYWKMDADQKNSTSTFDTSGYYNHGFITGATLTNEGRFKEGYKLDGSNDYINTGTSQSLNLTGNQSISAWIKYKGNLDAFGDWIVGKTNSVGGLRYTYALIIGSNNLTSYYVYDGTNAPHADGTTLLNDNKWHHLVGVRDTATDKLYIYVDGVQEGSVADSTTTTLSGDQITTIGVEYYNSATAGTWFNGTVDEVRTYNRALTASEVAGLYNGTKTNYITLKTMPENGGLNDTPAPTSSNETGLVGYWKMDDYVNGNTTDSHIADGTENNGSVIGATFNSSGRWNKGYSFDGLNDYISAGNATNINFGANQDFSVSAWFKTRIMNYQFIMDRGITGSACTASGNRGFTLSIGLYGTNNIDWKLNTGSAVSCVQITSTTNLSTNTWYHVAVTNDRDGNANIYLNGVLDKTASISAFNSTLETVQPLRIGAYLTETYYPFNGTIDEVRVYNRSLSADEVKELYLSKGLVGYWKMDADQRNTTDTYDSSGYYNHGKLSGPTFTNEGRFKEGYKFDGTNDLVNISHSASVNLTNAITISAWAYNLGGGGAASGRIVDKSLSSYVFFVDTANNRTSFYVTTGGVPYQRYSDTNSVLQNRWNHLAVTFNSTNVYFYVNGASAGTGSIPGAMDTTTIPLAIGNRQALDRAWNGTIDEVRIYNRVLSSTEIGQLYNGGKTNHLLLTKVLG